MRFTKQILGGAVAASLFAGQALAGGVAGDDACFDEAGNQVPCTLLVAADDEGAGGLLLGSGAPVLIGVAAAVGIGVALSGGGGSTASTPPTDAD